MTEIQHFAINPQADVACGDTDYEISFTFLPWEVTCPVCKITANRK